jgi:dTDP-glucose 4,6-dehydratase
MNIFVIGGLDVLENLSMARCLLRATGKTESRISHVKDRPGHDRRYALTCEKLERELGWKPAISLDEGLRKTMWYRTNTEWLAGVRGGEYLAYYEIHYANRGPSREVIAESGRGSPER